jgi:HEPN/RES N-terminal domain 1/RES domain/Protein of unknown function (DUF2934)
MGFAKRQWEEERARPYSLNDKSVCVRCFDDYAIKNFIKTIVSEKQCSFCGLRNRRKSIAAPGNAVLEFILRGINSEYGDVDEEAVPYDSEEGEYIVPVFDIYDILHEQLPDISSDEDVLDWIVNSVSDGLQWCQRDPAVLSPADGLVAGWEDFCEAVKHKTRYLFFEAPRRAPGDLPEVGEEPYYVHPSDLLEQLAELVNRVELIRKIPAGTTIFRARSHDDGIEYKKPEELGPPTEELAKAGRMNAAGIVVFYGALEEATSIAETARGSPSFSIGTFELVKSAAVLDLTNLPPIPSIFDMERIDQRVPLRFLRRFCADVSEPIVPDDRIHVEYTPTQVVSEFIKLRFRGADGNPVDGVLYPSSRRDDGRNLVLFLGRENIEGIPNGSYREPTKLIRLISCKTISVEKSIRARAYELYERRGKIEGAAFGDWLRAEAEIRGERQEL